MHEVCWKLFGNSKPTPIYGGVNGMVVNWNFKVLNLLLTMNDDVLIGSCTSTCITKITTSKGLIFK